jgi:hypothetical protein
MARFNEILVGRYNRLAQKLLSMKGPAALTQLGGELQVVLPMFFGAENRYLESWDRFALGATIGASVGNTLGVRLRNPGGSNVIAVLEKITYSQTPAGAVDQPQLQIGTTAVDLSTIISVTLSRVDARGRSASGLIPSSQAAPPALAFRSALAATPLGTNYEFIQTDIQEFPVLPGDGIQVQSNTFNNAMAVSLLWRERLLEDSERA